MSLILLLLWGIEQLDQIENFKVHCMLSLKKFINAMILKYVIQLSERE